jgi:serine/threonine protein kinase/Tfp pilus assembly protein PilF
MDRMAASASSRRQITAGRWQKLKAILADALEETSSSRRAELLRQACANDLDLLREAEALLSGDTASLEQFAEWARMHLREDLPDRVGERLGAYRIIKEIGRGGMGAVYLAERADGHFERQVALKVLKRGTDTEEVLRRFRAERQILAKLDHPCITQLFDAGVTSDGLPYFVMELVSGQPITSFANAENVSLRSRLELFLKVCSAVRAAHENGIIHRDIKPSNVLVKPDGQPKLLDFGIAKVIAYSENDDVTVVEERRLTPKYAAPELHRGESVTAATDVYSLGTLLGDLVASCNSATAGDYSSSCIKGVITRSTHDDPKRRQNSIGELMAQINGCLQDGSLTRARYERWPKWRMVTAVGITVVILAGAGWLLRSQLQRHGPRAIAATGVSHPVQAIRSLAILPFEPIPKNSNDELLGLGMADAVIGRLSNIKQLSVFPTTTMLRYNGRTDDPAAIAKALNADAVLSGTIQRVGDRLRVTVQLSDGKNNRALWSDTFEETFTDVFSIQDSIAGKLAQALTLKLTQNEKQQADKRFTRNPAAYDAYLVGLHLYNKRTKQELAHAIDHFRQAVEQDPNFALAYALMADCYYLEGYYRFASLDAAVTNAKAAAEHALLLDDTIAEAHVAMAMVELSSGQDDTAVHSLRRALELNTNLPVAHQRYAWILTARGKLEEAIAHMKRAQELDPLSAANSSALGILFVFARQPQEALRYCGRAAELEPDNGTLHGNLAAAYELNGMLQLSIDHYKKMAELSPESRGDALASTAIGLWRAGRAGEAQAIMPEILTLAESGQVDPYNMTLLYAAAGKKQESFGWFAKTLSTGRVDARFIRYDPFLDPLRHDPGFGESLHQYGEPALLAALSK